MSDKESGKKKLGTSKSLVTSMPTMADVARHANVSKMTVSRTLTGNVKVSEETRLRVMEAINTLGYVLDQSAGSLSSKKTGFIAGLVPTLSNFNFADAARGISETLDAHGLQLLL